MFKIVLGNLAWHEQCGLQTNTVASKTLYELFSGETWVVQITWRIFALNCLLGHDAGRKRTPTASHGFMIIYLISRNRCGAHCNVFYLCFSWGSAERARQRNYIQLLQKLNALRLPLSDHPNHWKYISRVCIELFARRARAHARLATGHASI